MAQFWADQYGKAGGAFDKTAAAAKQQAEQLTQIYDQYRTQQNAFQAQAYSQAHPSSLARTFSWLGRDVVAPIGRSPVGRHVIGPAAGLVGGVGEALYGRVEPIGHTPQFRFLLKAVNYPHELVNRATYAAQLLARQNPNRAINPLKHLQVVEDMEVVAGALGLARYDPPAIRAALEATRTPKRREALRAAGKLQTVGESIAGKSGSASALLDFAYQFVDPTLVVGKAFKAITLVDDARKADLLISKSPSAVSALTSAIAKRAEKMADALGQPLSALCL